MMPRQEMLDRLRRLLGFRQTAYRRVFTAPGGQVVLRDLANFCRANVSTFHDNERVAAKLDGRREVWLRIQQHLQLTPAELFALVTGETEE